MADCINFPFHGDSSRVFENLMQSAILFLAVKVAKVGPEYWVQPSPQLPVKSDLNSRGLYLGHTAGGKLG